MNTTETIPTYTYIIHVHTQNNAIWNTLRTLTHDTVVGMTREAVVPAGPRGLVLGRQRGGVRAVELVEVIPQVVDRA